MASRGPYRPSASPAPPAAADASPPPPPPRSSTYQYRTRRGPGHEEEDPRRPRTPNQQHYHHHRQSPHLREDERTQQRSASPRNYHYNQHPGNGYADRRRPTQHEEEPAPDRPPRFDMRGGPGGGSQHIGGGGFFPPGHGQQQYFHDEFDWPEDMERRFFRGPRGFSDAFPDFGHPSRFHHRMPVDPEEYYYQQQQPQQHPNDRGAHNMSSSSSSSGGGASIPIRVVHERSDATNNNTKHPYAARNTTDLPARGSPTPESPRLGRAMSEPPKSFQQKLRGGKPYMPAPDYDTLPEQDEHQQQSQQQPNLSVPAHLSKAASSPSVPSRRPHQYQHDAPQPPPRKGSPTKMRPEFPSDAPPPGSPDLRKQSAPPGTGVRHIPIFVEGREDPVMSRNRRQQNHHHEPDGQSFMHSKPSDFYPSGTQRVQRGAGVPEEPPRQRPTLPEVASHRGKIPAGNLEPTSPVSPPPGPIPMGCSPSHLNVKEAVSEELAKKDVGESDKKKKEPTSPMPAPKGPIPMPCSPDLMAQAEKQGEDKGDKVDDKKESAKEAPVNEKQNNESEESKKNPEQPEATKPSGPEGIAKDKMDKVKSEVAKLVERIQAFKGDKKDKEYLYLDEMLTRHLLSLDGVETFGKDDLRQMRKESIRSINRCLSMLDAKARGGEDKGGKEAEDNNAVLDTLANLSS